VVRVDSGQVLGRTPLTINLPPSNQAVAFRFEKVGYRSATHKVIPDLEKAIRVDLVAAAAAEAPQIAAIVPSPAPPAAHAASRPKAPHRKAGRAGAAPAAPENRSRDTSKQFRSATPVNPFDM